MGRCYGNAHWKITLYGQEVTANCADVVTALKQPSTEKATHPQAPEIKKSQWLYAHCLGCSQSTN